jgi:hypothetical protein
MDCECINWARTNGWLAKHHPSCPKYNPEKDAIEFIAELVKGIEAWASDEDGVHDSCWLAYKKAKFIIGEPIITNHRS